VEHGITAKITPEQNWTQAQARAYQAANDCATIAALIVTAAFLPAP
jgi:hypothetical protein